MRSPSADRRLRVASSFIVAARWRIRLEAQPPLHHVAGHVAQPPVMGVGVGTQPGEGGLGADSELDQDHAGADMSAARAHGPGTADAGTTEPRHDIAPLPDLLHGRTGAGPVRTQRPVYLDLLPPCNAGCPAGENIQAWLAHV